MKKLTMISMAALLLMAVSCKKDKKDEIENAGSGFRATVESHEGDSKTHLDVDGKAVKWDSGDAILVKSSTCTTPRGFTTTGSGATVNFDADQTLPADFYAPPYTGYYPAAAFSGDQLTLPDTQDYEENSFASGANPMAATSSETLLPFKNICGVLKLQLYSTTDCQVQSITITTSDDTKPLYGTGTVTLTDGIPALGTLTGGGSTLTLDMGTDGAAMSTSESQPTAYYFVVPAGTLGTSFTVKVTETNGKVWSKTAGAPQNLIARNQITEMPKQPVTTQPDIPVGALPGVFTIDGSGTKVYFSKGNLQYNMDTTAGAVKWRFALNQYECIGSANKANVQNTTATEDTWIDLFGWGTSGYHQESDTHNTNYNPWATSTLTVNTTYNYYGYGPSTNVKPEGPSDKTQSTGNISGSYYDWGVNNAIINGGGEAGKGKWRTLTQGEWAYLIGTREVKGATGYGNTCVWATVKDGEGKDVKGLIIFPDDYAGDTENLNSIPEGCVFLPAAGRRKGTVVSLVGSDGYYWSSSYDYSSGAYYLYFSSGYVYPDVSSYRYYGFSVRLVSEN